MGYVKDIGSNGGGLPDYSIIDILYPRKWVNGSDVREISGFVNIPSYNSSIYPLTPISTILPKPVLIPVEFSFSMYDFYSIKEHTDWIMYETSGNWYLRIMNPNNFDIKVSFVFRYTADTMI